ncbi:MAG: glycosyltransferase [Rivularia sp. (in: cyanobacteria)]
MKIVFITTDLDTGGAEIMLYHLLSKINRQQFSPSVVSLMDNGVWRNRIEGLGIPVHSIGMEQGKPTLASLWQLIQTVNRLKPDLIQGWMYHGNIASALAKLSLFFQVPMLWSIHHSINSLSSEKRLTASIIKLGAYLSRFSASNIFVSQTSRQQHEKLGYRSKHNCVIPNGFDTSIFVPSSKAKSEIKFELSLPEDSILIGKMGRYHPMKDHSNFLKAAALISHKYSNVYFILAGTGVDKDNRNLAELIKELNLVEQIKLLGERHDMPRLIAALDIATVASAYGEAFPLIVGEAMSCGVPCAVTNIGDSALIVENTGRVVAPKNPEAMAQAWQELIEIGTENREALGKAARVRIQKLFSLDSVVSEYEKLYVSAACCKSN